jgi:hypothetical protein
MAYNRHARDDDPNDPAAGVAHAKLLKFLEQKLRPSDLDEAQLLVEALFQAGQEQPGTGKIGGIPQPGGAMDASLRRYAFDSADPVRRMQDVRAAEAEVSPVVGPVVGMDSAVDIFSAALSRLGVDAGKIHPSAMPTLFRLARQRQRERGTPAVAMDSRTSNDLATRYPGAARINIG